MKKTAIVLGTLLSFSLSNVSAHEQCASANVHDDLLKNNSAYAAQIAANEEIVQSIIEQKKGRKEAEEVYTIPVVIHVVHTGEAVGVGSNISEAQITSGIDQLNAAFRNTHGQSIDTKIQFELARIDPNCNSTTGIIRIDGSTVSGYSTNGVNLNTSGGAAEVAIKDLSRWPNSSYYNIWLVSEFDDNNGGGGTQGFAYFPGSSSSKDGAMIMNTAWGNQGTVNSWNNQGKTGIHEIGHALDLYHTFEGDNSGTSCPATSNGCGSGAGDCCDDTSPHIRSSSDCRTGVVNSCTGLVFDDVIHNYMDYSNQNCQYMFSTEQKSRMRAALEGARSGLLTSKALDVGLSFSEPAAASCSPQTGATGLSGNYSGILNVKFGNIDHTSGYAMPDGGYLNVATECLSSGQLTEGQSYDLSITVGLNTNNVKAWIDFNNDGSFNNTDELVFDKSLGANETGTESIALPSNAVKNTYIRLRVMNELLSPITDACYAPEYGQAEDYALSINTATDAAQLSSSEQVSVAPNPFSNRLLVNHVSSQLDYQIVDMTGKILLAGSLNGDNGSSQSLGTAALPAGSYFFVTHSTSGSSSQKIIKIN